MFPSWLIHRHYKSSAVAEMGDRLATIDMGRKLGAACPFLRELGSDLTQCGVGRGLPPCQVSPTRLPQYSNITSRQAGKQTDGQTDRQDNGPIAQGEPFYSQRNLHSSQKPRSRFLLNALLMYGTSLVVVIITVDIFQNVVCGVLALEIAYFVEFGCREMNSAVVDRYDCQRNLKKLICSKFSLKMPQSHHTLNVSLYTTLLRINIRKQAAI